MAGAEIRTAIQQRQARQMPTTTDLQKWWESGERVGARTTRALLLSLAALSAVAGVLIVMAAVPLFMANSGSQSRLWVAVGLWAGAPVLAVAGFWRYGAVKADFLRRYQRQKISDAIGKFVDPELQTVIELNQARMDAYHELTLGQAAHAYRNTQVAMAIGFLVLAAGAATTVSTKNGPTAQVVVGGLAGIGTGLSGYIVATFLRAQREALGQLNVYFRQPLTTSYLLTAERWALKLPKSARPATLAHMADQVVAQAFGMAGAGPATVGLDPGHRVPAPEPQGTGSDAHGGAYGGTYGGAAWPGPDRLEAVAAMASPGTIPAVLSDLAAMAAVFGHQGATTGQALQTTSS